MLSVHMRGAGERREDGRGVGRSPLRVFFRASPLICPLIILGKRKGRKGLFKVTLWLHWQHPHLGGAFLATTNRFNAVNE